MILRYINAYIFQFRKVSTTVYIMLYAFLLGYEPLPSIHKQAESFCVLFSMFM
jgi:hypothetical protein